MKEQQYEELQVKYGDQNLCKLEITIYSNYDRAVRDLRGLVSSLLAKQQRLTPNTRSVDSVGMCQIETSVNGKSKIRPHKPCL
jgi:hypothetical protein